MYAHNHQSQKKYPLFRSFIHIAPLFSAYCYTWFLGHNNPWLRAAQSLGWFMFSLSIRRAFIDKKKAPENIVWAFACLVLFMCIQNITAMFDPTAIFAIVLYGIICVMLQISTIANMPNTNLINMTMHSVLAGAMFYFLLEEYIFLDGLWFWIAVATGSIICMLSIKKHAALKQN